MTTTQYRITWFDNVNIGSGMTAVMGHVTKLTWDGVDPNLDKPNREERFDIYATDGIVGYPELYEKVVKTVATTKLKELLAMAKGRYEALNNESFSVID